MSIWEIANPGRFARIADRILPALWLVAACLLTIGLGWGLLWTPPELHQGQSVKILFVHVPAALVAVNSWLMMLVASLFWLVRRHHVSSLAARAAAPVGAAMTVVALLTGAVWGSVTWGVWWAWDARLTSFLILFLFYLGYLAVCRLPTPGDGGADLAALLCLVGSVFALLSRYAVNLWSKGLHQPASLSLDRETNMHAAYHLPLVICMAGFTALALALIVTEIRTEIRSRRSLRPLATGVHP